MRYLVLTGSLALLAGVPAPLLGGDCNGNGAEDALDVEDGRSPDCNSNGTPDECEQSFVQLARFAGEVVLPNSPALVVSADIDGDGRLDLITASTAADDSQLAIYLNLGADPRSESGNFSEPTFYPTGQSVAQLANGDLDGDGRVDLVTLTGSVSVFWNDGGDELSGPTALELPGRFSGLEVVDLNHDGAADLAVAVRTEDRVAVLTSNRNRTFSCTYFPVGDGPRPILSGDFDGDGLTDVMANRVDATMLLAAPDWKLVEVENTRGIHVYASDAMDVDADGDLDYVAGRYSPGLLFWLECRDAPAEQPWPFHVIDDQPDGVHGILLKDLNADGRLDVAVASSGVSLAGGDWLAWWEAPEKRLDPWKKHSIADGQVGATHLHAADFNGDERLDFIASMGHGVGVYWFEAPGWKRHAIDSTLRDVHCLVAVDLDADGDVDAASVSRRDFVAAWFENDGRGRFTRHVIDAKQSAYDMRAADMDRDGDLDLVVAGAESDNVVWLENPSR